MNGIAGAYGRPKTQALRKVDAAGTWQFVGDCGGDHACRKHAVGDTGLEDGRCRVFGVDMQGIVVARHCGEQDNVGFGDRLGESRRHADSQIGEFVATKLVHGTILSASIFEKDAEFARPRSVNDARMASTGRLPRLVAAQRSGLSAASSRRFTSLFAKSGLCAFTFVESPFGSRRS